MPLYPPAAGGAAPNIEEDDALVTTSASVIDFTEPLATIVTDSPAGEANVALSSYLLASGARALAGNLSCANNLLLNIGSADTDFTAGGGLNVAGFFKTGTGSFSYASVAGDAGISGNMEVNGGVRIDGTVGLFEDPNVARGFTSTFSTSTITAGQYWDYTYSGSASVSAGINVLDFNMRDQSTSPSTFRAIRALHEFDRASLPASNVAAGIEVVSYGIKGGRAVTSGTYTWDGVKATATNASASVAGATFTLADFRSSAEPTGFSGASSFIHWSFYAASDVYIDASQSLCLGTTSKTTQVMMAETVAISGTVADGYVDTITVNQTVNKSGGVSTTMTRLNWIDLQNPTSGAGVTITDGCIIRFNAAAGTHKYVDGASIKVSPGVWTCAFKMNVNGTVIYIPGYASRTS